MSNPNIYWEGQFGRRYGYWIHEIGVSFRDVPGNYIYAKETQPRAWRPIYIGQTANLNDRLDDHEKEACARRNGATHIHAHASSSLESVRKEEEKDLIRRWNPLCNEKIN